MFDKLFVLAEAGVNHNGSLDFALELVEVAAASGADGIKFQTFVTEELVALGAKKAPYQEQSDDEDQYQMLKSLELSFDEFRLIRAHCAENNILFLSTAFDPVSFKFLHSLDLPFWKIPSGEITNVPFLIDVASTRKPVVLSTGMSTLNEIDFALATLRENGADDITLLHCTTAYPTPVDEINLRAMTTLQERFNMPVGYSDHTEGEIAAVAAVARGAVFIEKHFTLDRNLPGPDHKASLEPDQLRSYIRVLRTTTATLGSPVKTVGPSESANLIAARKSIVAHTDIAAGERFEAKNLTTRRPGDGLSPVHWTDLLERRAKRSYAKGEPIDQGEMED